MTMASPVMLADGREPRLLYDLSTVAYLTSQSRAVIEREVARGSCGSIKRGRRRLVTRSQLAAYVARVGSQSA